MYIYFWYLCKNIIKVKGVYIILRGILYCTVIFFLVIIVLELIVRLYVLKGKKETLNYNTYTILEKMLKLHENVKEVKIEKTKRYQYNPIKNSIGIKGFDLKTIYDNIASLHEGGHCISVNMSLNKYKKFLISQYIIAINRLIVIPMFLLNIYSYELVKNGIVANFTILTIGLIYFIIASILRLSIGLSEEYYANKIAMNFIYLNFEKNVAVYTKKIYRMTFLLQMFQTVYTILIVVLIYVIFLIDKY